MDIALISLSSCLGCQMVFLGLEEYLYELIGDNRVVYAPFLMDQGEIPPVSLALVEGTVRNTEHFLRAREAREKAERVVALGTCACFGGVQGLADLYPESRIMERRFGDTAFEGAPQGVKRLLPLDSFIRVDAFLPGCPPTPALLEAFLRVVVSGEHPRREAATVCAECRVTSPELHQSGPRRLIQGAGEPGYCLLESGFICLGPVTRDGCGAPCPTEMGVPCRGCRGPAAKALGRADVDVEGETVRRLARATGRREEEIRAAIPDSAPTYYLFSLAEPLLRRRRPGGTATYLHRLDYG
ncbi:MAG: hypothetical protein ACUVT4_08720 [Actinomycetota bacterium]